MRSRPVLCDPLLEQTGAGTVVQEPRFCADRSNGAEQLFKGRVLGERDSSPCCVYSRARIAILLQSYFYACKDLLSALSGSESLVFFPPFEARDVQVRGTKRHFFADTIQPRSPFSCRCPGHRVAAVSVYAQ